MKAKMARKGFTLVEVIVVLVILAVLAAILIPSMIGWINKSKDKAALANARSWLNASKACFAELYSEHGNSVATNTAFTKEIANLAEADECTLFRVGTKGDLTANYNQDAYTITNARYEEPGIRLWYMNGKWIKQDKAPKGFPTTNKYTIKQ